MRPTTHSPTRLSHACVIAGAVVGGCYTLSNLIAGAALVLMACSTGCSDTDSPAAAGEQAATVENIGPATTTPNTSAEVPPASRSARRLRVEQLRNVISDVAGNDAKGKPIRWTVEYAGETYDALDDQVLAPTLGHPNYFTTTTEPAEATPLYAKFADDMARDVCGQIIDADATRDDASQRVLTRFVDGKSSDDANAINENLRYLQLRFLGEFVESGDTESLAPLQEVYDGVAPELGATEAWRAICVTLLTSPQFHVY